MLLAGLAVLLQALVVQTHVHNPGWRQATPAVMESLAGQGARAHDAGEHSGAPHQRDHAACAICQTLAGSGGGPANAAGLHRLAPLDAYRAGVAGAVPIFNRAAFFWKSRAPPL